MYKRVFSILFERRYVIAFAKYMPWENQNCRYDKFYEENVDDTLWNAHFHRGQVSGVS